MRASTACRTALFSLAALATAGVCDARPTPLIYAYDLSNDHLVSFLADAPSVLLSDVALTGLVHGSYLLGIDFRPLTHELMGIESDGRVVRVVSIDTATGVVTGVGAGELAPAGDFAGIDFNPTVDRIRLVTDAGTNMRWNPNNGAVAAYDTGLSYDVSDVNAGQSPNVVDLAYLNHGPNPTTAYGIDTTHAALVRLGGPGGVPSPNLGLLFTVGSLGVAPTAELGGFDIEWQSDRAFVLLRVGAQSSLSSIDLATGATTLVGNTPPDRLIDGLAIPEPGAIAAGVAAIAGLVALRRRG